jgi:aldose 1-epimerase
MREIVLSADELRLTVRPEWGGRVASFSHARAGDILVPIEVTEFDPEAWPKGGAYPLTPFHNRVRDARFAFAGREAQLASHPSSAPHALHGMASRLPWTVAGQDTASVTLTLHRLADAAWPWTFEVTQRLTLDSGGLSVELAIVNLDTAPMPAGLGWHPFFTPPLAIDQDARDWWPHDAAFLPIGERRDAAEAEAPAPGRTAYLADWSKVEIRQPGSLAIAITADPAFTNLVLHWDAAGYACAEPVTHVADALTLAERLPSDDAIDTLPPAGRLAGRIDLRIRATAPAGATANIATTYATGG